MADQMVFGVWMINGINQTNMIGGNASTLPDRLTFDPDVSLESPVVRGTWITAEMLISMIIDGYSWGEILRRYPELDENDLHTVVDYASRA